MMRYTAAPGFLCGRQVVKVSGYKDWWHETLSGMTRKLNIVV